jgi:pyruvate dehydrogenase E2 component (dihydrolipoamide acetyltransferase)
MISIAARRTTQALKSRALAATGCRRLFSSELPEHEIVPMPALSPTMEFGGIANWTKSVGEEIGAGDIIVEIETDKATVDFEAQDDAFLAKILVEAGTTDIACGTPIAILVEDASDVAAFADFVPEAVVAVVQEAAPTASEPAPTPTPAAPTPPPVTASPPTPTSATSATASPPAPAGTVDATLSSDRYGAGVRSSALSSHLLDAQQKYNEMYGSTLLESKGDAQN